MAEAETGAVTATVTKAVGGITDEPREVRRRAVGVEARRGCGGVSCAVGEVVDAVAGRGVQRHAVR